MIGQEGKSTEAKRDRGRIALRSRRRGKAGYSGRAARVDVALAAYELTFIHPETGKAMTFSHNPSGGMFRQFQLPERS